MAVYSCDPHSPWQRGVNENTNGLLRQYVPKGKDLSVYTQEQWDEIAGSVNTRPRKTFGCRSPVEGYSERLRNMELAQTATTHYLLRLVFESALRKPALLHRSPSWVRGLQGTGLFLFWLVSFFGRMSIVLW